MFSGIINNIRCELSKISPEHSTHPAAQVEDGSGTSLQRRVSSIAHVLATPEEKRSGRGFDGKGGGFRMENLAKELGVVIPSYIPDGPGGESKVLFNPGDTGFKVFQAKFAKIGVGMKIFLYSFFFVTCEHNYMHVTLVASDRIGKEVIETEHGQSQITFYENSFIAGEIVAEADDKTEAVLVSQFNLEKIKSKRQSWGGVP
ncbi:hypothetical protein HID58_059883 [Brassica napus]|uniref:Uncharacterized protein n=1 Tax=Brassica napus TaxID=3708 RepID=A0ABQ7ZU55_BRANA|nr:hypothetical protein HID58_059883 [Brassica napus]